MAMATLSKETNVASVQIENLTVKGYIHQPTNVANYLGIPYARVPARFRQAVLLDPREQSGDLDATKYAPSCPQPGDPPRGMRHHLYAQLDHDVPAGPPPSNVAESAHLTLNIYAPAGQHLPNTRLPVVVWIHGGGWNVGDGNAEFGESKYLHTVGVMAVTHDVRREIPGSTFRRAG